MLTGKESAKYSRKPEIVADAAYAILSQDPKTTTGNFFIDDVVLKQFGVTDFDQYCVDPAYRNELMPDFFLDDKPIEAPSTGAPSLANAHAPKDGGGGGKVQGIFDAILKNMSAETVKSTQAVFQFVLSGEEGGKW